MPRPLHIFMALITAFLLSSWAIKGFPTDSAPKAMSELQPKIKSTFGKNDKTDQQRKLKAERIEESTQDASLNKIRNDTIQAAQAYSATHCDQNAKEALITALTAYTKAWQNKLSCFRPLLIFTALCGDEKLDAAAAAFSTPLDKRVREALEAAFDQRGIVRADFPSSVRDDVAQFAGMSFWGDESPVCTPVRRNAKPVR